MTRNELRKILKDDDPDAVVDARCYGRKRGELDEEWINKKLHSLN